jgi:flagellar biosynthetic protein FliR
MMSVLVTSPVVVKTLAEFGVAALREAAFGLAFGFGFMVAYAATQIAGRALDVQIGFGAASILNPATQGLAPLIGSVFGMMMVVVFLALDGHHILIRALAASIAGMPPGGGASLDLGLVIEQSGVMFAFGLALAAPVMFMLWLTDVAMAIFARSMPQLNVFVLSFAIKIVLGTVGLALSIGASRALFEGLFDSTFRYWGRLAGAQ